MKCKYDIEYIKSNKVDFSKIEENQIRDLMLDGFELNDLIFLTSQQIDSLLYKNEECYNGFVEEPYIDDEFIFQAERKKFIPEIPYSDKDIVKVKNGCCFMFVNIRMAKDNLKFWEIDFSGLNDYQIYNLYCENICY